MAGGRNLTRAAPGHPPIAFLEIRLAHIIAAGAESFDFFGSKPVVVEPAATQVSSDAGLLPFRQRDEQLGLTRQFAAALTDRRQVGYIDHTFLEMTRSRVYGILADYADQNDHDVLRSDPIFKLLCDRSITGPDLASQPTLSRFENAIDSRCFFHLQDLLLDQFIAAFDQPPTHLTLDIDPFDDPDPWSAAVDLLPRLLQQCQYLPRAITCAENDLVLCVCLLHGTAHPTLGAPDDLAYVVRHSAGLAGRAHSPSRRQRLRHPRHVCGLRAAGHSIHPRFGHERAAAKAQRRLLKQAVAQWEATGQPQRLFTGFWYRAESWPASRWVVVKCEAHAQGTNRRAVVTNRAGAFVLPAACYDEYANRGESENRNKELKNGLQADRLSDHRYFANLFRLYLHTAAYNLLVRNGRSSSIPAGSSAARVPTKALTGRQRRDWHNRRRKHDPLGEGQPCTWRTRLIKVAACVRETSRRVVVELSASWPYLEYFQRVGQRILQALPTACDSS